MSRPTIGATGGDGGGVKPDYAQQSCDRLNARLGSGDKVRMYDRMAGDVWVLRRPEGYHGAGRNDWRYEGSGYYDVVKIGQQEDYAHPLKRVSYKDVRGVDELLRSLQTPAEHQGGEPRQAPVAQPVIAEPQYAYVGRDAAGGYVYKRVVAAGDHFETDKFDTITTSSYEGDSIIRQG